jgi:hypothetical protein
MQLDSAAMAKYGIQLKSAERAWLVKTQEMERIIQELMSKSAQKDTVRDSIPYPVIKEVEVQPSWWQRMKDTLFWIIILIILLAIVIYTGKKIMRL